MACAAVLGCGCKGATQPGERVRLATTTSTENSGLLDVLLPIFERETGIRVLVMPMGTGKALRVARDGNCDVVLVHDPVAETEFVEQGWGVSRRAVMYNHFVILGPPGDPAGAKGADSPAGAMKKIAAAAAPFVSRGDKSGTHRKETQLWRQAGVTPGGRWYRSVGKGMGETVTMADEMQAYVLVDHGTFVKFRPRIALAVMVEGGPGMHNPYSVIAVNPARHPHVDHAAAMELVRFLTSQRAQGIIAGYTLDGQRPFWPNRQADTQPSPAEGVASP